MLKQSLTLSLENYTSALHSQSIFSVLMLLLHLCILRLWGAIQMLCY